MDGTLISAMRTGAVTALGLKYLAPRDSRKMGIVGAGVQARTQILALMNELPQLNEIAVFSRTPGDAKAIAEQVPGSPRPVLTLPFSLPTSARLF